MLALIDRRRLLLVAFAQLGNTVTLLRARADNPGAVAPIKSLCDTLLRIMRAGKATPISQRYSILAPVIDRTFDLSLILQISVGPAWSNLQPEQQDVLLATFRRFTMASYVSNFDHYDGQRFDIVPDSRELPNGQQIVRTHIISSSGESRELSYVMHQSGGVWTAVDVLADGSISRVVVQRSDFGRLVARGGGQALIDSLNQKTADLSGDASLP